MKASCPRCNSTELQEISDGYYKCLKCGYIGTLGMDKSIFKK